MSLNIPLHLHMAFSDLLLTGGVLVVVAAMVAVVLLLLVVAELLVGVFAATVEFVSIEILASMIVELLGPAPNVNREPAEMKINSCGHMIQPRCENIEITTNPCRNITKIPKCSL